MVIADGIVFVVFFLISVCDLSLDLLPAPACSEKDVENWRLGPKRKGEVHGEDKKARWLMDAVEWTASDGSRVRRVRVVDFQMDASLAMAKLRDLTETFAGYRATMMEITNETIMAIPQLQQLTDGVRQTTMQSLDVHWSE